MSGGHWNYKQYEIEEQAERVSKLLAAVAETEHIIDWAICGDTSIAEAPQKLFDLWEKTFDEIYGS